MFGKILSICLLLMGGIASTANAGLLSSFTSSCTKKAGEEGGKTATECFKKYKAKIHLKHPNFTLGFYQKNCNGKIKKEHKAFCNQLKPVIADVKPSSVLDKANKVKKKAEKRVNKIKETIGSVLENNPDADETVEQDVQEEPANEEGSESEE